MLGSFSTAYKPSPQGQVIERLRSESIQKKLIDIFVDYAAVFSRWSTQNEPGYDFVSDREIERALNELRAVLHFQESANFGIKAHGKKSGLFVSVTMNGTGEAFGAHMIGNKDDIIMGSPDEVKLLTGDELRRMKFDEFLEEHHELLYRWKNDFRSVKQQQCVRLLRDVLSYSHRDEISLHVFPHGEKRRLEITLNDRLIAIAQIERANSLYFREYREGSPNLAPESHTRPDYSSLYRTIKPIQENLSRWAQAFEAQLALFTSPRVEEELDKNTRAVLVQELSVATHTSDHSTIVIEGELPTLSLELKEGLRLLCRAEINIATKEAQIFYHMLVHKYALPCTDRRKDELRKSVALEEVEFPEENQQTGAQIAQLFQREGAQLMLWNAPQEEVRPGEQEKNRIRALAKILLQIREASHIELVVQNGEPTVFSIWRSGKPLLETTLDFDGTEWKLHWLYDYRTTPAELDSKRMASISFREARTFEKVFRNAALLVNRYANSFRALCQPVHTAQLSAESKEILERALMDTLGVSRDGQIHIRQTGQAFHIVARQGLELVAELEYSPGDSEVKHCYHRAFIDEKRPAPEEFLFPLRGAVRPKTLIQIREDPEGSDEPEEASRWQLHFSDPKLESFLMMNPPEALGGAVVTVEIDEPIRFCFERSVVYFRTILADGSVNDCARIEIAEDGRITGIVFEMLDQDPMKSYRYEL